MAKNFLDKDGVSRLIYNFKSLFATLSHKHEISDLTDYTVDSALSSTSTNPIQNKVVNEGFSLVIDTLDSMQNSIKGKADASHNHDNDYDAKGSAQAVRQELEDMGSAFDQVVGYMYGEDQFVDENANITTIRDIANDEADSALNKAKKYTDERTQNIASDGAVNDKISAHNTATSAHSDIRDLITSKADELSEDIQNKQFFITIIDNGDDTYSADKTFAEIEDAYTDGKLLYCNFTYNDIPVILQVFITVPSMVYMFSSMFGNVSIACMIGVNDSVEASIVELPTYDEIPLDSDINKWNNAYDIANTANTNAVAAQNRADSAYTLAESKVDSLSDLGITATDTELNYVDGVTSNIQTQLDGKAASSHNHDTEYAPISHTHDDSYYTESEIDSKLSGKSDTSHNHDNAYDSKGSAANVQANLDAVSDELNDALQDVIDKSAGKTVTGEKFTINEVPVSAGTGAEIFNAYDVNKATGVYSHAEGYGTEASASYAHAEGSSSVASGNAAHAEGFDTKASAGYSHAEGYQTQATANYSHAEGFRAKATAQSAHAEGYNTKASSDSQHVEGKYNIEDNASIYAHIIGNGTGDGSKRSNAHTVDWNGNAWYAGNIRVGGKSYDEGSELALKSDLDQIDLSSYETTANSAAKLKEAKEHTTTSIATHDTSNAAHSDIRELISGLTTRLNAVANSTDTELDQLAEIVDYIKANKSLIDSITTSKINVSDIVNNLTTNSSTKVLSAAQGVAIKQLIDNLQTAVNGKANSDHDHKVEDISDLTASATELNYVKGVTKNIQTQLDEKQPNIFGAATSIIYEDLEPSQMLVSSTTGKVVASGIPCVDFMAIEFSHLNGTTSNVQEQLNNKADSDHDHAIADVSGLQTALDGKANSSHGTHVSYSSTAPVMDGTASAGSASTVSRSDHKHPTDTTRAAQTDLDALTKTVSGKANTTHSHAISDVTNLQSTLDAKVPTTRTINGKALSGNITLSASDVSAYSKSEIENYVFITTDDIDTICGESID